MTPRFSQRMADCFAAPDRKRQFNEELFTEVAPKYDFVTRALSLGRDHAWKRHLIAALPDQTKPTCVDLACGTGDVCELLHERYPDGFIIGVDLTPSMLAIARERDLDGAVDFRTGDMCALDLPNATADVVTGSYALRNAPDVQQALAETARILKPGGAAAFLDFSKPRSKPVAGLEYCILKTWGSFWGLCLHRSPQVYGYIAESLRHFPDRRQLRRLAAENGFEVKPGRRFYAGVLELLVLQRYETDSKARDA